jgi:ketosteroid isomerase-like protein
MLADDDLPFGACRPIARGKPMRKMLPLAILLVMISLPALAQSAAMIQAQNDRLAAAFDKGDAAAVRAMYGADAVVLPDRGEMVRGKDLTAFWRAVVRRIGDFKRVTLTVEPLGPGFAQEIGRFSFRKRRDRVETSGKYVAVWQKDGSAWKRITDIWNRDR